MLEQSAMGEFGPNGRGLMPKVRLTATSRWPLAITLGAMAAVAVGGPLLGFSAAAAPRLVLSRYDASGGSSVDARLRASSQEGSLSARLLKQAQVLLDGGDEELAFVSAITACEMLFEDSRLASILDRQPGLSKDELAESLATILGNQVVPNADFFFATEEFGSLFSRAFQLRRELLHGRREAVVTRADVDSAIQLAMLLRDTL